MSAMEAFVVRTAAEIDQLVTEDFDVEQRIAEHVEELASRPNTAALQRPCTASVPSRIAQRPSVLDCLAHITTKDSESEESFYARIIETARQQRQTAAHEQKEEKRTSLNKQRRGSDKQSSKQQLSDVAPSEQKRDSVADVYVVPSRTHSPPLGKSRPSTSSSTSSFALWSASRHSLTSVSSSSATPRSQLIDNHSDDVHRHGATAVSGPSVNALSVSFGGLSTLERDVWYVEQSQLIDTDSVSSRPFSRRTSIRSRFPAIAK